MEATLRTQVFLMYVFLDVQTKTLSETNHTQVFGVFRLAPPTRVQPKESGFPGPTAAWPRAWRSSAKCSTSAGASTAARREARGARREARGARRKADAQTCRRAGIYPSLQAPPVALCFLFFPPVGFKRKSSLLDYFFCWGLNQMEEHGSARLRVSAKEKSSSKTLLSASMIIRGRVPGRLPPFAFCPPEKERKRVQYPFKKNINNHIPSKRT